MCTLVQELLRSRGLDRKFNSVDSEISEASTLVSTCSDKEADKGKPRISHQSIRGALSDSEMETTVSRLLSVCVCVCVHACMCMCVCILTFMRNLVCIVYAIDEC